MRLFRKRQSKPSRWPRRLKTTREGKLLIAITLGLGFGAINSGNNLLYLILGMLLSLIVVSGVLSELTLRGIRVTRRYSGTVHAGRETFLAIEVHNAKRRLGSFSVEVEELLDEALLTDQRPAYTLVLRPGERQTVALRVNFVRRGLHQSTGLRVATRFPFSFFRKSRDVLEPFEFVVYPEVRPVQAPGLGGRALGIAQSENRVGRGEEYHGLREHHLEDDPRDIHWKTSARLGRLVSREYERAVDRRVWLLVANTAASADEPAVNAVEASISEAASLAAHYTATGWAVGLRTHDGVVNPGTGAGQLGAVLNHLARIPVHADGQVRTVDVPAQRGERLLVRHPAQSAALSGAWDHVHEVPRGV